jgi:hypothetical protein
MARKLEVGQVRALLDNRIGEALEVGLTAGAVERGRAVGPT